MILLLTFDITDEPGGAAPNRREMRCALAVLPSLLLALLLSSPATSSGVAPLGAPTRRGVQAAPLPADEGDGDAADVDGETDAAETAGHNETDDGDDDDNADAPDTTIAADEGEGGSDSYSYDSYDEGEIGSTVKKGVDPPESSYSYDEGEEEGEGDFDFDWDDLSPWGFLGIALVVALQIPVAMACFGAGPLHRWLSRRHAMSMARTGGFDTEMGVADGGGAGGGGPLPTGGISNLFGKMNPVRVVIESGGAAMTIGAPREHLTSVSQLPFTLTDACVESGYPELQELDLVDLLIRKRATLELEDANGGARPIDSSTVPADIKAAKCIRVKIHAEEPVAAAHQ